MLNGVWLLRHETLLSLLLLFLWCRAVIGRLMPFCMTDNVWRFSVITVLLNVDAPV